MGHNYRLALVINRVLFGGLAQWLAKENAHHLTPEQLQVMFEVNNNRLLCDDLANGNPKAQEGH